MRVNGLIRLWFLCGFVLLSGSPLFSREVASHDSEPSSSHNRHSSEESRFSGDLYKVSDFKWRCGTQPPTSTEDSYFILAMVEKNSNGIFTPAKEGSLIAECKLLEVTNEYVERAIGEAGDNYRKPSVLSGEKLGNLVSDKNQNYIVLSSKNPMAPPDFIAAPCGEQGNDKIKSFGTHTDMADKYAKGEIVKNDISKNLPKKSTKKELNLAEDQI